MNENIHVVELRYSLKNFYTQIPLNHFALWQKETTTFRYTIKDY